jgi:hypothetical protein
MSGSCCGGSPKSAPTKVAMTAAPQAIEAASEQPAENSHKGECCNDKPAKSEKHGCGC